MGKCCSCTRQQSPRGNKMNILKQRICFSALNNI
jgi:hypothetical protein